MRAAGLRLLLLLLLLGLGLLLELPQPCRARCPGQSPPGGHNETLGRPVGTARSPDVVALVAVGGWLGSVLLCVGRFVRRSREETRLQLQDLRALPCGTRPHDEELEPLSSGTGRHRSGPEG